MKNFDVTVVAALAAALALPAAASPAFDTFKAICGDSHTDFAAIKAALAGPEWKAADVMPTNMEGVTPSEGIARATEIGGKKVAIYAWEGMKGQFHLTACTARVTGLESGAANDEARAWLRFAPEAGPNNKSTWRFGVTKGAWASVKQADFQAAAAAGGLYFLNAWPDHGEEVLDLLKIKS